MASGPLPRPPHSGPGPARGRPVELLVDEIPPRTTEGDVLRLFTEVSEPGEVRGVFLQGRGALVRMRSEEGAERVASKLSGRPFRGLRLSVRRFHTFKIFVGLLSPECTSQDLRDLFEEFGPVVECSVVRDYAFVHMMNEEEARAAIEHLNGWEVKGKRIAVEASRVHKSSHNFKEMPETKWNNYPAPSYRNTPSASHRVDYRAQPSTGHSVAHKDQPYASHSNSSYQSKFSTPSRPPPAASARTSYNAKVASSHDRSYEARPARPSAHLLESYEDEVAFEDESFASGAYPPSEQSVSYRSSYRAEDTRDMAAATYKKLGNNGASYTLSDSLSMHGRASADANYGVHQPTKVPLASSYIAQPEHGGLIQPAPQDMSSLGSLPSETAAHHIPYERVRLSPPRAVHDDYYREFGAANKQYASKPGATAALHQRYEHVRLSPPRTSREDLYYRGASASKLRYASEPEAGALRRPYERVRLSPPRSSHSAKRRRDE